MKKLFASLNFVAMLILLGVLFILVNYVSSRRFARIELTKQQFGQISEQTEKALDSLDQPVEIILFYQPGHQLYEPIKDLLEAYARRSPKIRVEYLDPDQDRARAQQIIQEMKIDSLNLVIFKSGSRHKYLPETELAEFDYASLQLGQPPQLKGFKAESAFTSAIRNVTQAEQPVIWVVTGHGEKEMDSPEPVGLSEFKRTLEQQNMSLQSITLLDKTQIAPDIKLLVVAGPTRRFTDAEISLVEKYLDNGGRLLALLDPLVETGLEALLERWGVTLGNDIVVDPTRQLPFVSAANLFVVEYLEHPIVASMRTLATLFPLARSVRPKTPAPEGVTVSRLAETSQQGWGETTTDSEAFQYDSETDTQGPVSIAVAVESAQPRKTRIVVVGDSEFAINAQVGSAGNRDLLSGAANWLVDQEVMIGIGPKPIETIKLQLTEDQVRGLMYFSFAALPLACLGLGLATWWLRRT